MSRKVLVVDDDPTLRMIFARELKRDFDVTVVDGAVAALAALDATDFDAVVSDLSIGAGMDGVGLLTEVQKRAPRCARILVTGSIADDAIDEALSSVVHRVITKPWPAMKLAGLVVAIIESIATSAG